jgi:hypothetical protein
MEQDSVAVVDDVVEEPTLPTLPAEVEVPLPEEPRAPTPPSLIRGPAASSWPLEIAAVPGVVDMRVEIPPPADYEEEEEIMDEMDLDLGDFLLDGTSDILDIHPGGNGDIEFDGDNLMGFSPRGMMPETEYGDSHLVPFYDGVMPGVDDALQLNDDLVGHEDGDVYVNDDDDNESVINVDLRHVDEMPHHVFVAPPPNPEPSEGGFVFGAASGGSSSNTSPREDAEDVAPSSRPMTGTFGPNQRDFRLTVPSIVNSWTQQSVAEISVPDSIIKHHLLPHRIDLCAE